MPLAHKDPRTGRSELKRPLQVLLAALLLGTMLAAVGFLFPGLIESTWGPQEPHGIESPGREIPVSLLFEGEAQVTVDGERAGEFTDEALVMVRPGRHRFEVRGEQTQATRTVVVEPGGNTQIDLRAERESRANPTAL